MEFTFAERSVAGPVRDNNEDHIAAWIPENAFDRHNYGAVLVLADGVGGQAWGEVASELAGEAAIKEFKQAGPGRAPNQVLWSMFNTANLEVYDTKLKNPGMARMATTLSASIIRNNEITVGHVGDSRVYLFQDNRIRRLTNDHSYTGVQLRLGLISVDEANASENRSMLTRTVGQEPMIRVDYHRTPIKRGDWVMQCTDGLYCFVTEGEIFNIVTKNHPEQACDELIALVERRGGDDNISVQIVRVDEIDADPIADAHTPKAVESQMGTELEVGQVLDGRYQTTELIARSGMASIFKAIDQKTGQTVALKVPFMQFESDPGFYSRFEREEKIGQTLQHPFILRVEPTDGMKSRPYIVMEFLEGQTLAHLMRSVKPIPVADAMKIAARICEALQYMHENDVIHRDLKPDNIMICNDGSIRVMDFGIAKYEGQRRLTFGGFTPTMGTPDYMAPEQVRGKRGDKRTDIYSLGAIIYEMVTGSVPFEGSNPFLIMNARLSGDPVAPRTKNPQIPDQVEEVILHAMERDPGKRYADSHEMQVDLKHWEFVRLTGRVHRLKSPSPWVSRWRRNRVLIWTLAIVLIVVIVFFIKTHVRFEFR